MGYLQYRLSFNISFSNVPSFLSQARTSKGKVVWTAKYNGPNAEHIPVGAEHGRCFLAMLDSGEAAFFVGAAGATDAQMRRAWTTDGCRRLVEPLGVEGLAVLDS
jgi:hypothetical protein